jgi:proteic killer suppression protein
MMIRSFKNKETRQLYQGERVKKWHGLIKQAERRLEVLDHATCLEDLMYLPSNRFEALGGDRKGQYSIRINMQWRICFEWIGNEPYHVEIVDYH